MIVGVTNSFGNGGMDGLVTKIDKRGSVVWNKALGGTGDDVIYMVRKASDGGFIACGQTKSFGNTAGDAWLIKLDGLGNIQWSKKYGDGNVYGETAYDVTQLSDGGYAFAGTHKFSPGVSDGFVLRTDSQGNVIWSKSYGNSNSDDATSIVEDGNSLVVTGFYYAASYYDGYLMKLDEATGAVQWIRGYDAENRSTEIWRIVKTNTGYQLFSFVTDNFNSENLQHCIWSVKADGSLQNVRKVAIPGTWSISYGWYPLADGGFISVNGENNNGSDLLSCRVNADGSLAYSKQYPIPGKQSISNMTPAPGGGFVLAGYTTFEPTVADSNNIYIMSIDSLGNSCSAVNATGITVVNPSYALPTPDVIPIGNVAINNPVITVPVVQSVPISNTICQNCSASGPPPPPPDTSCVSGGLFQKIYGGGRNDFAYSVAPATDSGHVIVGYTNSFGSGGTDGLITKMNKGGKVVWNKAVGGSGDDILYMVKKTSDGGFVTCGQTKSYGNPAGDVWLIKLDAAGNVQWSKKYGDGNANGEISYDVTELSDGGYAIAGTHKFSPGVADGFVLRTDSQGNVIWSKSYGNGNSDQAAGIMEDGNFLLVAGFYYAASYYDGYVMKLDKATGVVQWIKGYDAENRSTEMLRLAKTNTGYQVFSLVTDNFADQNVQECMWNLNVDGSVQNVSKLAIPGTWTVSYGWYPLPDGGFIGANGQNTSESDVLVTRVNANGSIGFSKQFQVPGKQSISGMTSASAGGYAFAGFSSNAPAIADSNNVYVLKIDSVGSSCSSLNTSAVTVVTPSYALRTPDVAPIGNVSINNPVITVTIVDSLPITNTVCQTCVSTVPDFTLPADGSSTVNCPADAIQPTPPTVVDSCGTTLTPTVTAPSPVACNGIMAYVFKYTDCGGHTHNWTYTYTIAVPDFALPPDGSSTVSCPANAIFPTAPTVFTACGDTIPPIVTLPSPVICSGTMVYEFAYTDCAGHSHTWRYTYTISTFDFTLPADGSSTVHCPADAVAPTAPVVVDACGNTLFPVAVTPSAVACNGTMAYTFIYTDCAGHSHNWTYTYTIAIPDFTLPADGSSTVSCAANAVEPTPPTVIDACGNTISSTVFTPPPVACSGTMTFRVNYIDCAGHSHDWRYTYTIADVTPPTITCVGNKTIDCNAPVVFDQPTATDGCDSSPTIVVVSTSADGLTRTWRATDACGNSATCSQTITVATCGAHLFPTATTCCNYVTGTAPQLQKVCYTKSGNSISKVVPGVFFYYSFVTAPASGPFVITVEQLNNNTSFQLFAVQNVTQIRLTDMSCGTTSLAFSPSITGTNGSQAVLTVSSYSPGATYVVSVKYDAKSIIGSTFAGTPTASCTFRSKVNGAIAAGTTGTLNAQFGCQDNTPNPSNNCQLTTIAAVPTGEVASSQPTVRAYPNPFTDIVNFQITANVSGKATLEVYNLDGQKLGVAFEGLMVAGEVRIVQYKSRTSSGGLIYQLTIADKKMAGKVFSLK